MERSCTKLARHVLKGEIRPVLHDVSSGGPAHLPDVHCVECGHREQAHQDVGSDRGDYG